MSHVFEPIPPRSGVLRAGTTRVPFGSQRTKECDREARAFPRWRALAESFHHEAESRSASLTARRLGSRPAAEFGLVARANAGDHVVSIAGSVYLFLPPTGVEHHENAKEGEDVVFFTNLLEARKKRAC